jgi:hypothetical protein
MANLQANTSIRVDIRVEAATAAVGGKCEDVGGLSRVVW